MKNLFFSFYIILCFIFYSCNKSDNVDNAANFDTISIQKDIKILSLGDSYTIGESVCKTCSYPEQLKNGIKNNLSINNSVFLKVIAQTGWTTSNLINAISNSELTNNYDIVTLLIGVNNQYQNGSFSLYEEEFPKLVDMAINYANGNKNNVIVISIPDYAFTPYGQNWSLNPQNISDDIDQYNRFAENYCMNNGISFVNVTDISREGLDNPILVAHDQLHPSSLAHSKMAERILPVALSKIE